MTYTPWLNVMPFDPAKHHRRSIRLKGYDDTQTGAYFVTICTQNRECLFSEIVDGFMRLNGLGEVVRACWHDLPHHYAHVELDAFVVMPNHVHGIIGLTHKTVEAGLKPAPTTNTMAIKNHGLPEIVRAFKTFSSRRVNEIRNTPGTPVWQRNYYETIIRNEESLNYIRKYITDNPLRWAMDQENPRSH